MKLDPIIAPVYGAPRKRKTHPSFWVLLAVIGFAIGCVGVWLVWGWRGMP